MAHPHDLTPLQNFLNEWLFDYMIVTGYNSNSLPCLFISSAVKPVKVAIPLFYIDTAIISYNGAYHVQFLPGVGADNVREITKCLSHYKPA